MKKSHRAACGRRGVQRCALAPLDENGLRVERFLRERMPECESAAAGGQS